MKLYTTLATTNYEWINTIDDSDYELFRSLDGKSQINNWKPIRIKTVKADKRQKKNRSDFPFLGSHILIFRSNVLNDIGEIIKKYGEILKLNSDEDDDFYCLNCYSYDWLDYKNSEIQYIPNTNRIMRINKIVPNDKWDSEKLLFRFNTRASPIIINEEFIKLYIDNKYKGLDFIEVGNFT